MNAQNKVRKVMGEFGSGSLRSSSGQKVTNPKQAMAIALSEQRRVRGMKNGGMPDETKGYQKHYETEKQHNRDDSALANPVNFGKAVYRNVRKLFTPKPSETRPENPLPSSKTRSVEDDVEKGDVGPRGYGNIRRAKGGNIKAFINRQDTRHGKMDMPYAHLNKYVGKRHGGDVKNHNMGGNIKYVKGGGIEKRGKTRGAIVRMAAGGSVSARADGIAQRGKTRCKMV